MRKKVIIFLLTLILSVSVYGEVVNMANKYCNLNGANKISDEYNKINNGFDAVQLDVESLDAKSDAIDSRVDAIITTPAEGVTAQEIIDARKGETTLRNKIDGIDTQMADIANENASYFEKNAVNTSLYPEIIDMHYKVCRGVGFHASESTDTLLSKAIATAASKGSKALIVDGTSGLYAGQLIVLHDISEDEYYTNVISGIAGTTVNLVYPLETDIAVNDALHNFYINNTHPNVYGYKAIADIALRELTRPMGEKLFLRILPTDFEISGTGSVGDGGFVQDYTEPFSTVDTKVLTVTTGQSEIAKKLIYLEKDMYLKFKTYVTIGTGATLNFQISNVADTVAYYIENKTSAGTGMTEVIEVVTFLRAGSYNFKLQTVTPGSIAIGKTEIFELSQTYDLNTFNRGTHVLLGDSWFAVTPGIIDRLEERLPNATFLNYGVGGNEIDNLYRRFTGTGTDIDLNNQPDIYAGRGNAKTIPHIDFTWVMCGTNDYVAGTPASNFKAGMDELVKAIMDYGSKPLIFTSSVGVVGTGSRFSLSRQYADLYYNNQFQDGYYSGTWTPVLAGLTAAGANTYATQIGTYYKVGKMVTAQFNIVLSAKDAAMAGSLIISGLPFEAAPGNFGVAFAQVENVTLGAAYSQYGGFTRGSNDIVLIKMGGTSGSWDNIAAGAIANNTKLRGTITYFTN